jgi:2,3-bisphosphoglycerate-dependent phosphoglycerate mutase
MHTLLLCCHGDSIWNGGQPGTQETFTGWTDVLLSQKGIKEASNTGKEVSSYSYGIDVCFTSILGRAKETAHHCLWAFSEQPLATQPKKYVSDYRLNERHYGSLQGFVKCDVENGIYGHDSQMVKQWRRNWHAIPPVLDNDDPRWIEEIRKYGNFCGGADNVPRGESLEMVATNRIRPFLDEVLNPIMEEAAQRKRKCILNDDSKNYSSIDTDRRDDYELGGTGLVIAHANSLRALIGVICQVEKDDNALKKLEAMKIQTGVPLVMQYQRNFDGEYKACTISSLDCGNQQFLKSDLPVWPLSCIPKRKYGSPSIIDQSRNNANKNNSQRLLNQSSKPIRIDVI